MSMADCSTEVAYTIPYVFSPFDQTNKHTVKCHCCIAPIIVGLSEMNGREKSAIGHVSPGIVLCEQPRRNFRSDYERLLQTVREQTLPGTREVHVVGGIYGAELGGRDFTREYVDMIKLLGALTGDILETQLRVESGPKIEGFTHVAFQTQERLAHIFEPKPTEYAWKPFGYEDIQAIEAQRFPPSALWVLCQWMLKKWRRQHGVSAPSLSEKTK